MPMKKKQLFTSCIYLDNRFLILYHVFAGPPYNTDDPEPTPYKHWEYYISTINNAQGGVYSGTLPHLEFNYGIIPNMQIHLLLPLNYSYGNHLPFHYGYGDTELGFKYRFVKESDKIPEIGTFPIFLVPTAKNSEFASEKTQVFIPLWLQKSWGKLTSFGGGGYWINPGTGNKNWVFTGLTLQYDFTDKFRWEKNCITSRQTRNTESHHLPSMLVVWSIFQKNSTSFFHWDIVLSMEISLHPTWGCGGRFSVRI